MNYDLIDFAREIEAAHPVIAKLIERVRQRAYASWANSEPGEVDEREMLFAVSSALNELEREINTVRTNAALELRKHTSKQDATA